MVFIYILQLENKKYYIGKTLNPEFRLEQHFNSSGSQWTKKYKPKKVLQIIPNCDNYDRNIWNNMVLIMFAVVAFVKLN